MGIKLAEQWIKLLQSTPESGMGYHIVKANFSNGVTLSGLVVVNCDQIVVPDVVAASITKGAEVIEVIPEGSKDDSRPEEAES